MPTPKKFRNAVDGLGLPTLLVDYLWEKRPPYVNQGNLDVCAARSKVLSMIADGRLDSMISEARQWSQGRRGTLPRPYSELGK